MALWVGAAVDTRLIQSLLGVAAFQLIPADYKVWLPPIELSSSRSYTEAAKFTNNCVTHITE